MLSKRGRGLWADPRAAMAGLWAGNGDDSGPERKGPFRAVMVRRGLAGGLSICGLRCRERPRMRTSWNMERRTSTLPASDHAGDVSHAGAACVRGTRGVWDNELAGMY